MGAAASPERSFPHSSYEEGQGGGGCRDSRFPKVTPCFCQVWVLALNSQRQSVDVGRRLFPNLCAVGNVVGRDGEHIPRDKNDRWSRDTGFLGTLRCSRERCIWQTEEGLRALGACQAWRHRGQRKGPKQQGWRNPGMRGSGHRGEGRRVVDSWGAKGRKVSWAEGKERKAWVGGGGWPPAGALKCQSERGGEARQSSKGQIVVGQEGTALRDSCPT